MKAEYEIPAMEIIEFDNKDIITDSLGNDDLGGMNGD